MKMSVNLGSSNTGRRSKVKEAVEFKPRKRRLAKVRDFITKYVSVEEDAIFKDPDWPHLWDHKRDK